VSARLVQLADLVYEDLVELAEEAAGSVVRRDVADGRHQAIDGIGQAVGGRRQALPQLLLLVEQRAVGMDGAHHELLGDFVSGCIEQWK
jgi:hypothetical protein